MTIQKTTYSDFFTPCFLDEESDHLGNVNVVVSDMKIPVDENTDGTIDYYKADILSAMDYYPFGMIKPNVFNLNTNGYRFGYQGSEKDDEITGVTGANFTTFFRENDTRIGRWSLYPEIIKFAGK